MNRIEQLLNEYCPQGVEYKRLGDIASISRGGSFQKKDYVETGVPCIHYGQIYTSYDLFVKKTISFISEEKAKKQKKAVKNDVIMAVTSENIDDVCKCIAWLGNDEVAVSGHTAIIHHDLDPKYLVYYLNSSLFYEQKLKLAHGTKVIEVTPSSLERIEVPVPPLEVQREIVRVLDNFTLLQAELSAELSARQKQYDYYRDKLVTEVDGIAGKLIDMLERPITDGPHTTPVLYPNGVPFVSATAVYDGRVHLEDMKGYISKEFDDECAKKYKPQKHDVFMVKSGSTTGKVAYVDFDDDFNVWSPIAAMRTNEKCSSRYLYHLLQTASIQNQVKERMSQGSQPNLSMRVLEQFDVIIPSRQEQERIASLLDKMDELSYGFNQGIPAEINARRKQYEFYRDKLLSFGRG